MGETQPFPFVIKNVTEEEDAIIKKYYKGYIRPFVRIGPHGYLWPAGYGDHAAEIYNLEVRPDDIWVASFSRSGTTWLQELVWLVMNNLDFDSAIKIPLSKRYAFIEYPTLASEVRKETANPNNPKHKATEEDFRTIANLPSPRYIKTHTPLSLLSPKLLDVAKVFYIARDPRDVAVSYHFMHKLFRYFDDSVEFKDYWELAKRDLIFHSPIEEQVREAWERNNHPNMMFLLYEEMQKVCEVNIFAGDFGCLMASLFEDLLGVIDKVCSFLGKDYTKEQKEELNQFLKFDNMSKKPPYSATKDQGKETEITFMRKGKSGNWVQYFDDKMKEEAEEYMNKYLSCTKLKFPDTGVNY